jgi:FKBP-type peptidyl-prolyl cis-trans isomerase
MKRQWMWVCVLGLGAAAWVYGEDEKKAEPKAAEKVEKAEDAKAGEAKPGEAKAPAEGAEGKEAAAEESGEFGSLKAKVSYGIGLNIGSQVLRQGFDAKELDVDVAIVAEGVKDALSRAKLRVSEEQLQAAMEKFQAQMSVKQEELEGKRKEAGDKAKKEGEAFLAANAKKEGVKVTDSGLQYQVLKQGDGARPKVSDTVSVHYKGTLINGEEFDSSYKRNEPATFPLEQVIPAWTEGLQLMTVGSKYKLFVPYELGYGAKGNPPKIPGYSVLVFEVELLGIEK